MEQNKKQAMYMISSVWSSEKVQEASNKVGQLTATAK
jgi:hypothetical protein